ncbi:unnamed protein product [Effrenium voratum]|uniref:Carbamoyltransferase n=1 Tax=Effrenium voratum TaxID=2562239 RepID=A0AA36JPG9_9DINO|nr:unnamed protein product [Effrenium voratum]
MWRVDGVGFFVGHDASIAVSSGGRISCVLELERLFRERYFRFPRNFQRFGQVLAGRHTRHTLYTWHTRHTLHTRHTRHMRHTRFAIGVIVLGIDAPFWEYIPSLIRDSKVIEVDQWEFVDHHKAHAALGFYASPFRSALVVSYDGGGNDGSFNAFVARAGQIEHIGTLQYNFGDMYMHLAELLPEVSGKAITEQCRQNRKGMHWSKFMLGEKRAILSLSGKLMGYSGIKESNPKLNEVVKELFKHSGSFFSADARVPFALLRSACNSTEDQQTLAASIQVGFEEVARDVILALLKEVGSENVDGLVLTGGCALNVLANQKIHDLEDIRLYVPPAPNDCGLAAGGLWTISPPPKQQPLQYLGFRLWDEDMLERVAFARRAVRLSALGGVDFLAELLAGGVAWQRLNANHSRPIVAVVRGRQEFGPRALGHRSLLAVPDATMRERMNRLKARQWYRPVAPMIAKEDLAKVFGREVASPYMTMAPRVVEEIRARFPALAHLDGTARHQSVSASEEPWIHALLVAVGRLVGLAALINTSFNTKGFPIVNTVRESLEMLDKLPDLDFVVIEDWLFPKRTFPSPFAEKCFVPETGASLGEACACQFGSRATGVFQESIRLDFGAIFSGMQVQMVWRVLGKLLKFHSMRANDSSST